MLKLTFLAVTIAVAGVSKADQPTPGSGGNRSGTYKSPESSGGWQRLDMHSFRDAQGVVIVDMPFPVGWKIITNHKPGEPTIVGPHGVSIVDFPLQAFLYPRDARLMQSYRQSGQPLRVMPPVEQLIQQDIAPWATKRGLKFVRQYEVPEVSRIDQWYDDQMFKAVPSKTRAWAVATEWASPNGDPFLILLHLMDSNTAQLQIWSYRATTLQVERSRFEAAKQQLFFGLANARYNPQPIMAFNQSEARKAGKSWADFNRRMAQNQANFEASQRAFVNRSNAAHDALMNNWKASNAASDRTQERFVDTINERSKMVDPSSGKQYKVDAGRNHYWMNSDGRYVSTDRQDYDPNLDKSINNQKWQQLKKAD